jgi:hypothetical protein
MIWSCDTLILNQHTRKWSGIMSHQLSCHNFSSVDLIYSTHDPRLAVWLASSLTQRKKWNPLIKGCQGCTAQRPSPEIKIKGQMTRIFIQGSINFECWDPVSIVDDIRFRNFYQSYSRSFPDTPVLFSRLLVQQWTLPCPAVHTLYNLNIRISTYYIVTFSFKITWLYITYMFSWIHMFTYLEYRIYLGGVYRKHALRFVPNVHKINSFLKQSFSFTPHCARVAASSQPGRQHTAALPVHGCRKFLFILDNILVTKISYWLYVAP